MNFGWTEEETMWRRAVREFAQKKIAPRVREIDSNNRIPDDVVKGMTDMGLWAPTVSEQYGGQGMNVTMATIAAEELGRAEISLALPVWYLVEASWGFIFDRYASPALKQEILPDVTAGQAIPGHRHHRAGRRLRHRGRHALARRTAAGRQLDPQRREGLHQRRQGVATHRRHPHDAGAHRSKRRAQGLHLLRRPAEG